MSKEQKTIQKTNDEKSVEFVPFGCTDKIRLTASMVRQFIAVPTASGALPNERDCIRFIMLCRGKRANPFEGDCFLIGYDSKNGPSYSMVCGLELFLKRAEQNVDYDGCKSGIVVVSKDGQMVDRKGCILLKDEQLVGGWAEVKRKDRNEPFYKTANIDVYNTQRSRWLKDPAGMIEKVAKSQALREAFPTALGGLYTQEEMQKVTELGEGIVQTREPIQMPKALEVHSEEQEAPADPQPTEQQLSAQEQFSDLCTEHKVSFDDARQFLATHLATKKLMADADSMGGFEELPEGACLTVLRTKAILDEMMKRCAKE